MIDYGCIEEGRFGCDGVQKREGVLVFVFRWNIFGWRKETSDVISVVGFGLNVDDT